ncbi:MAG: M20/M25/M40 family metallo-hydrolase [Chloroflexi bacterium]|nr:M20/M25/M40 family metallo-hydrolase [Chloroflexota bacterium]
MSAALTEAVAAAFPSVRSDLESLARIPSVSAEGSDTPGMPACGERVADLLRGVGLAVRMLDIPGAPSAVLGERPGPAGAPVVMLYAHYDVQPAGDPTAWRTPPFEPVERNGRLYGRGASDDKAGLATHLGALRALPADLPLTIKVLVEGEEELGSPHAAALLASHAETLAADIIVVADSEQWRVGVPALTTSLRGLVDCTVEVRTLRDGVHSGQFGGAVPDALSALARLLATLHDDRGSVAIAGLVRAADPAVDVPEDELRASGGVMEGVHLVGDGPIASRLWRQPAVSVLAIDAPRLSEAINQIVPVARAKVSLRLAPGQDPAAAMDALVAHLEGHAPWGAQVTVTRGSSAEPFEIASGTPAYEAFRGGLRDAWGVEPAEIGVGGSIPLVAALARAYPDASILLTGVGEPTSAIHGPNESQDLRELERACVAEAIALTHLAGRSA